MWCVQDEGERATPKNRALYGVPEHVPEDVDLVALLATAKRAHFASFFAST